MAYGLMGESDKAQVACERARELNPELSIAFLNSTIGTLHRPHLEMTFDGLRKAGLPEE